MLRKKNCNMSKESRCGRCGQCTSNEKQQDRVKKKTAIVLSSFLANFFSCYFLVLEFLERWRKKAKGETPFLILPKKRKGKTERNCLHFLIIVLAMKRKIRVQQKMRMKE